MSRGKFWKLAKRLWLLLRALSEREKLIAIYCMTEQTNRVGLFPYSSAKAADDLGLSPKAFEVSFRKVCDHLGWRFDADARVLFLRDWWRYNDPGNKDAMRAFLQDLLDVPPTPLLDQFLKQTTDLSEHLRQVFEETIQTLCLPGWVPGSPPPCPPSADQGGGHTRLDLDKTKQDKDKTPSAVLREFEEFWKCYPKKVGKREALKAFQQAKDRPPIDTLLETIKHHAASPQWTKDNGQFIPHPATWLNKGRWTDEPITVAPSINAKNFHKEAW